MIKKRLKNLFIFAMLCMLFCDCAGSPDGHDRPGVETEIDPIEPQGFKTSEPVVEQSDNDTGTRYFESDIELQEWIDSGDKSSLTSVFIQGDITKIPEEAFFECDRLRSVYIGDTVHTIGEKAFYGCTVLQKIRWPSNLQTIEFGAFDRCVRLEYVILPNSVTTVEGGFQDCTSLQSILLSNNLTRIDDYMCAGCIALQEITIPDGITNIGYDPFTESGLKRITISGCIEKIESFRACLCPNLEQIVFMGNKPADAYGNEDGISDDANIGLSAFESNSVIYYLTEYRLSWAPNGETEWNGFPLVGIDSPADLPPLTETPSAIASPSESEQTPAIEEINGNLQQGGCAVKAEGMIYALDYYENETVPVIVRYDPETGVKNAIIELNASNTSYVSPCLSCANGGLFYKDRINSECIIRYDIQTGEQEIVAEPFMFEWFVAVNDKLILSTIQGEMWIHENGSDKVFLQGPEEPEGFYHVPLGIMEDCFYALCYKEDAPYIAVFDLDGNRLDSIDLPYRMTMSDYLDQVIPYAGKLYCLVHNVEQGFFTLDVYDATERRAVKTTKLDSLHMNSMSINISDGRVYLSGDGVYELNELGEPELISKGRCVAVTLIDGEPVERYARCDEPR